MRRVLIIAGVLIALIAFLLPSIPAPAADQPANAPRIRLKDGTSTNWSGYAVETNLKRPQNGAVTDVKGSWVVPKVIGPISGSYYSSTWVGIDGYSSNTVEQIGTDQNWINGKAVYDAWYEMYPKYPVPIVLAINADDQINAEVNYDGTYFNLTIINTTTGESFSTSQFLKSAKRSSAEWIMEAPWSGGVLPLANFGTINFNGAQATLNGTTGSISTWQYDPITMVDPNGGTATPSGLPKSGTSFSVTYSTK